MKINNSEAQIFVKSLKRRLDLHRIPIGQRIDFYFQPNTKNLLVVSVPLKRNITAKEIANSALYLLSDLATGVTGEIHHVDSGYNIIGMKDADSPDIFENQ